MKGIDITKDKIETVLDKKFIRVFDLQYEEGRHYFDASRRPLDDLVAAKSEEEFSGMLPDAVSCVVVIEEDGKEPQLLLSYEYRYPAGRFLLSVPAGLIDPEDKEVKDPLFVTAKREIFEETGITVKDTDKVEMINPFCV
jgi:ADP-ribose pyrophosphatase